jgi:hypothetical protein
MEQFNEIINKKVVIHSHKGGINAYIISILSYNKYNYLERKGINLQGYK